MTYYVPKTQKGVYANAWAWVIGILVAVGVITGIVFGVKVLTAPTAGKAGAFRQKESANNRVFAQQNFEQLNADIDGYVGKIVVAKQAVKDDPSAFNKTNLIGAQQTCIDAVQQYNADSRKYLLRDFKSAGLPYRRDVSECK